MSIRSSTRMDTLDMDEKDDGIEARFAKLEEFMNQHHIKEPANLLEVDNIRSAVVKHSTEESKNSLEDSKGGPESYKEVGIFARFEKALKEQQRKGVQDSALVLDLERILMRIEDRQQMPLRFKDAVGRKFTFPFHLVRTWTVGYQILQL